MIEHEALEKVELAKKYLLENWSIQYAFSKANINPNSEEYQFVYDKLIDLINEYKRSKINDRKHPVRR